MESDTSWKEDALSGASDDEDEDEQDIDEERDGDKVIYCIKFASLLSI